MIYILQSEVNIILCQRLSYYPLMTGKAFLNEVMLVAKVSGSSYVKSPHKGHSRPNLERGGEIFLQQEMYNTMNIHCLTKNHKE